MHTSHIGALLHAPLLYDLQNWLAARGRLGAYRDRLLRLADVRPGASVLDIGCGTGGLALAARRKVGDAGHVAAIDASPEMLARACGKARRAGLDVAFEQAAAQALPYPEASFDVVLSTIMLHHLPRAARQQCLAEVRRVLKPGGRLLVVEFTVSGHKRAGPFARLHRHGHIKPQDLLALATGAGLTVIASGVMDQNELAGPRELQFVVAARQQA